jgi:hypothetical protein
VRAHDLQTCPGNGRLGVVEMDRDDRAAVQLGGGEQVVGGGDADRLSCLHDDMRGAADDGAGGELADRADQELNEVQRVAAEHLDEAGAVVRVVGVGSPGRHLAGVALGAGAVEIGRQHSPETAAGEHRPGFGDGRGKPGLQSGDVMDAGRFRCR